MSSRDWPVAAKVAIVLSLAVALPLAVAGALQLWQARGLLREEAADLLQARAQQVADDIDEFHIGFRRAALRGALDPAFLEYCLASPAERERLRPDVERHLAAFTSVDARVSGAYVFDAAGVTIATTDPETLGRSYAFRNYLQDGMAGRVVISEIYVAVPEAGGAPRVAYTAPVRSAGRVVGVVVLYAHAREIWRIVRAANTQAGSGSFCVLLDAYGIRIAHSGDDAEVFRPAGALDPATVERFVAERRFGDRTRELLLAPIPAPEEFEAARGPSVPAVGPIRSPSNGEANFALGRRLAAVPWTLFFLVPVRSIDAPVEALARLTLGIAGAVIAIAAGLSVPLAARFVAPVRRLAAAAEAIGKGDRSARVPADRGDELGLLSRRFNEMADLIATAHEGLEAKVRERTDALEALNEQLRGKNRELSERTLELAFRESRGQAQGRAFAALAGEGELAAVIAPVLRECADQAGAVVLVCYRLDDAATMLQPLAGYGIAGPAAGAVPVGGLLREALKAGMPVTVAELPAGLELRYDIGLAAGRPSGVALVPLAVGDRPVGLLAAGGLGTFEAPHLDFLGQVAAPLALTISRHELFEQTRRFASELSRRNEQLAAQTEELLSQSAELAAQQRALEEKNAEVEQANRLKSEFLASMSHELRTPLNAIIGFSELLLDEGGGAGGLEPRARSHVEEVLSAGRHLLALINDILDLAKIEAQKLSLALEAVDPADAAAEACALVEPIARRRKIDLRKESAPSLPPVRADRAKLRQILLNLLSNAVKFGPEGAPVDVAVEPAGAFVRFRVRDRGPGIRPELMKRLFQPFVQGDASLARKHEGTGLGLAITKRLAEHHGGTVRIDSAPGEGATFTVEIPVAAGASEEKRATENTENAETTTGDPDAAPGTPASVSSVSSVANLSDAPRTSVAILAIDDDPRVGAILRATLEPEGYSVRLASTAADGVREALARPPAAAIVDLGLPDASGCEVIDRLRADARTRDVPLIVLTAADLAPAERERLKARGGVLVLAEKGDLSRDALLAALARATGRAAPPAASPANGAAPEVLVVEDHDANRELIRQILERRGYRVRTAEDGAQALAAVREGRPALVLMDLSMPGVDGLTAVRALRADPRTRDLPVVAVTGLATRGDESRAREAGFDAYLTKPLDLKALDEVLARYTGRGGG